MFPKLISETKGDPLYTKRSKYYCSNCGEEQPEVGGELRSWVKQAVGLAVLVVVIAVILLLV